MLGERAIHIDVFGAGHWMRINDGMDPSAVRLNTLVHRLNIRFRAQIIVSKAADIVHGFKGLKHRTEVRG